MTAPANAHRNKPPGGNDRARPIFRAPLRHQTREELAYRHIRKALVGGQLAPGQRIVVSAGLSPAAFPEPFLLMAALEALCVREANNRMAPATDPANLE
jgi:hypothetical protein